MEKAAKEEKADESNGDEENFKDEIFLKGKELENAKSKMVEAIEENQRLKRSLNQIMKDYQTLQTKYDIIARQASNSSMTNKLHTQNYQETDESDHFISLSLGRTSSSSEQLLKNEVAVNESKEGEKEKEGLSLGLDSLYEISSKIPVKPSPESSTELGKEEKKEGEIAIKSSSSLRCEEEEVSEKNPNKRARVSVRVRCDTPTMNDGCQWRKYGQKIAKGNPCPRAYYRCTVAPTCPVRKQVQRCAQDMSILIITYEGTHNHPLPMSATAMASATSAAASAILSGSFASSSIGATSSSNIHGLNFNPSDFSNYKQFHIPNNSTTPTNSTITLDLTSSSSFSIFNKYSSNYLSTPKYSPTNLSFNPLESNPPPLSWSGAQIGNSLNFGGQYSTHEQNMNKTLMQNPDPNSHQQTLASDTIAAATKAITSDPSFQSALVAALSSFIGNIGNGGEAFGNQSGSSKNIFEAYPGVSNLPPPSSQNEYNFSSSYLGRDPKVTSDQQGSMVLFQPQLPFDTTPKSKSSSPSDEDPIL